MYFSHRCMLAYLLLLFCQKANIPATYLSANMEWTEQQEILRELNSDYCKYKLLYVTPEKIARLVSLLVAAYSLNFFLVCTHFCLRTIFFTS